MSVSGRVGHRRPGRGSQPSRRPALRPLALLLLSLLAIAGPFAATRADADGWETTRARLIDPLNSKLHRHWPTELKARNLDVLLRLYATETGTGLTWENPKRVATGAQEETLLWMGPPGEETILDRYTRLLELFGEIQFAEQRIERLDWRNPGPLGHRTTVHTVVRGTSPDGQRRQLEQWATLYVRFFDPFWEITAEEVTGRTMVTEGTPRFDSVGEQAQIDSVHANQESPPFRLFGNQHENPVREASGVAVGDADGDGCEDLVLAGSPDLVFYRSRCDGTFEDATLEAGIQNPYPAAASGGLVLRL